MDKDTQNISVPENLKPEDISSGEELVPAEVAARKARKANSPQTRNKKQIKALIQRLVIQSVSRV